MIDHDVLNELREMVGEKFKLIIQTYLNNGDEFIARISGAIDHHDKTAIARAAHAFKSASGQMGALVLESHLADIEENAQDRDIEYSQEVFAAAKQAYQNARQILSDLIA